ncbi:MAG: Fur family transcriptional regulator [Gemmatimonadales bacterium]
MANLTPDEGAALLERFRRYLRDHRQPVTRQRDLVAELILSSGEHLSVDAIERGLKNRGERIGTATIYRTLDLLVEAGIVKVHDFGEGFRRFEPADGPVHHEHLICGRCGKVTEFSNERLERMLPIIADEHDFEHQSHRVEIYGVCRECQGRDLGTL